MSQRAGRSQGDPEPRQMQPTDRLIGKVMFDHGEMLDKRFGPIRIKGEFTRIQPRLERDELTAKQLVSCINILSTWVNSYFDTSKRPEYFDSLYPTVVVFTAYLNPHGELGSEDVELGFHLSYWLFYIDEFLECAMDKNISFQDTEKVTDQFLRLLTGEIFSFEKVETFEDDAESLFTSLTNIQQRFMARTTDFKSLASPLHFRLREYFYAIRWGCIEKVDSRYSIHTFIHWRQCVSYFETVAYVTLMLQGIQLPSKFLQATSVRRLRDICNRASSFVNDLLGIRTELENDETDNFVLFKVIEKGMSLDAAVEDECNLIETELTDFVYLREVVLQEFSNDENAIIFIEALENILDGQNRIFSLQDHYASDGCITLSR